MLEVRQHHQCRCGVKVGESNISRICILDQGYRLYLTHQYNWDSFLTCPPSSKLPYNVTMTRKSFTKVKSTFCILEGELFGHILKRSECFSISEEKNGSDKIVAWRIRLYTYRLLTHSWQIPCQGTIPSTLLSWTKYHFDVHPLCQISGMFGMRISNSWKNRSIFQ